MPGIGMGAEVPRFQIDKFTAAQLDALDVQMRQGVRAFLKATMPLVPIDTGMAVGSYLHLGRFLRVAVPLGPGLPGKYRTGPYRNKQGQTFGPQGAKRKDPELGAQLSTDPASAFTRTRTGVRFAFNANVYHYTLNEFGFAHGPWRSLEAGVEAFNAYSRAFLLKRIPKATRFLIKSKIGEFKGGIGGIGTSTRLQ